MAYHNFMGVLVCPLNFHLRRKRNFPTSFFNENFLPLSFSKGDVLYIDKLILLQMAWLIVVEQMQFEVF